MNRETSINRALDNLRETMRLKHMALKTEKAYAHWLKRYCLWLLNNPSGTHEQKLHGYLSHLANDRNVSASTQSQALNALVFNYNEVLKIKIGDIGAFSRARKPRRLPTVLSVDEVQRLLRNLTGTHWLICNLPMD